jgi:acetoin utilization protein AcuB
VAAKQKPTGKTTHTKSPTRVAKPAGLRRARAEPATVSRFMTRSVHTIGGDEPLSSAHALMNRHKIRHLPVLDARELVGVVSQRDLYFLEALDGDAPAHIRVDEAMTRDVYEAGPDTPLRQVARKLIDQKFGCVVVTKAGKVVGVFSVVDAIRALLEYLPAEA